MNINWEPLINAIVALTAMAIGIYILPILKQRLCSAKAAELKFWTAEAVKAAEQLFEGSGMGEEKLSYVRHFLLEIGLWQEDREHRVLIESTVNELENTAQSPALNQIIEGEML